MKQAGLSRIVAASGPPWFCDRIAKLRLEPGSAKRKGVGLDAGIEEPDLEGAGLDVTQLADELVEPCRGDDTLACRIGIGAMVRAGRLAVERHLEVDRLFIGARAGLPPEM